MKLTLLKIYFFYSHIDLEVIYQDSLHTQRLKLIKQRENLAKLRKLFQQEEIGMLAASRHMLNIKMCKDKQRAIQKILKVLEENRHTTNVEVLKAEGDIIGHYSKILKSRQQIESMLIGNEDIIKESETLDVDKVKLYDEIRKIQSCIDSKQYLKHLNVSTGLCALNNLIDRVEQELIRIKNNELNAGSGVSIKTN